MRKNGFFLGITRYHTLLHRNSVAKKYNMLDVSVFHNQWSTLCKISPFISRILLSYRGIFSWSLIETISIQRVVELLSAVTCQDCCCKFVFVFFKIIPNTSFVQILLNIRWRFFDCGKCFSINLRDVKRVFWWMIIYIHTYIYIYIYMYVVTLQI